MIFELAEKIRGKVPSFSLIDFVINTYPRIASHRAISLATLDYLFDRIEYDLKGSNSLKPLYDIFSRLSEKTLARQQSRWKLWGKMLLKAIFLYTIADRSPSVRELADSLLLFEDSEAGLSYNAVGMLLSQMEKDADLDMSSNGERLDRTYRLRVADAREEFDKYLDDIAAQIHDQDPRLGQTLLLAAERFFPDWPIRRAPFKGQMQESIPLSVQWNGTNRPGIFLFSQRFVERKATTSAEQGSPHEFSAPLPEVQPLASFDESPDPPAESEPESPEWVFCMEPVGLAPEVAALRPGKITEVRWVPGIPSRDELAQLKKILALHLADQSVSSRLPNNEMQRIRDDFKLDLGNLFQELYLSRARILTRDQDQALNQRHHECRTFQAFLNYIFKPNFRELYPLHPEFRENQLTSEHVLVLSRKLFSAQAPTDADVQKLAGQFALPLGLVSRLDHLYELNLNITPPPFITVVFQYLETLNTAEYSVEYISRKLHQSPFGLTLPSFHLILSALVADGQIELVDPSTSSSISRENLGGLEDFRPLTVFRKIQTHREFPTEVLTQWVRMITGNQEITDISATRGRNTATAALREWLEHWKLLGISRNLENLPNQIITTQMWTKMAWTKRRFDQVAEIVETVLAGQMTLIQGMAKIIDLFGENVGLLEKASRNLVELSLFLDWLDFFAKARNYVLASEKTESPEIEQLRGLLYRWLHAPHELVETEKSREFENVFKAFRGLYLDYYAVRHDQSLGPMGNFELLRELESSPEFRNLQLLSSLPMGDSTYLNYLDEWIALVRSIRCGLPVREILWEKPHCQCGFKLSRPLSVPRIVEDFRNFLDLGTTHHRQMLEYFRDRIEKRLEEEIFLPPEWKEAVRTLLQENPLPPLTQPVIDQIAEMVGNIVVEDKLSSPLPILAPAGRITKKHLQNQIQKWLDSLSDRDDVLLSFREE